MTEVGKLKHTVRPTATPRPLSSLSSSTQALAGGLTDIPSAASFVAEEPYSRCNTPEPTLSRRMRLPSQAVGAGMLPGSSGTNAGALSMAALAGAGTMAIAAATAAIATSPVSPTTGQRMTSRFPRLSAAREAKTAVEQDGKYRISVEPPPESIPWPVTASGLAAAAAATAVAAAPPIRINVSLGSMDSCRFCAGGPVAPCWCWYSSCASRQMAITLLAWHLLDSHSTATMRRLANEIMQKLVDALKERGFADDIEMAADLYVPNIQSNEIKALCTDIKESKAPRRAFRCAFCAHKDAECICSWRYDPQLPLAEQKGTNVLTVSVAMMATHFVARSRRFMATKLWDFFDGAHRLLDHQVLFDAFRAAVPTRIERSRKELEQMRMLIQQQRRQIARLHSSVPATADETPPSSPPAAGDRSLSVAVAAAAAAAVATAQDPGLRIDPGLRGEPPRSSRDSVTSNSSTSTAGAGAGGPGEQRSPLSGSPSPLSSPLPSPRQVDRFAQWKAQLAREKEAAAAAAAGGAGPAKSHAELVASILDG